MSHGRDPQVVEERGRFPRRAGCPAPGQFPGEGGLVPHQCGRTRPAEQEHVARTGTADPEGEGVGGGLSTLRRLVGVERPPGSVAQPEEPGPARSEEDPAGASGVGRHQQTAQLRQRRGRFRAGRGGRTFRPLPPAVREPAQSGAHLAVPARRQVLDERGPVAAHGFGDAAARLLSRRGMPGGRSIRPFASGAGRGGSCGDQQQRVLPASEPCREQGVASCPTAPAGVLAPLRGGAQREGAVPAPVQHGVRDEFTDPSRIRGLQHIGSGRPRRRSGRHGSGRTRLARHPVRLRPVLGGGAGHRVPGQRTHRAADPPLPFLGRLLPPVTRGHAPLRARRRWARTPFRRCADRAGRRVEPVVHGVVRTTRSGVPRPSAVEFTPPVVLTRAAPFPLLRHTHIVPPGAFSGRRTAKGVMVNRSVHPPT